MHEQAADFGEYESGGGKKGKGYEEGEREGRGREEVVGDIA